MSDHYPPPLRGPLSQAAVDNVVAFFKRFGGPGSPNPGNASTPTGEQAMSEPRRTDFVPRWARDREEGDDVLDNFAGSCSIPPEDPAAVPPMPCPFCGESSGYVERMTLCSYQYICDCSACGPAVLDGKYEDHEGDPEGDAVRAWNARVEKAP